MKFANRWRFGQQRARRTDLNESQPNQPQHPKTVVPQATQKRTYEAHLANDSFPPNPSHIAITMSRPKLDERVNLAGASK
jgi:hypothetical protein